jgi:hypothetical protein
MGSSTVHPDGAVSIACRDNIEGMIKAFDFWWPDGEAPRFADLTIEEAPPALLAHFQSMGRIPGDVGKVWCISVPVPESKDSDAHDEVHWVSQPTKPSREQAMWIAWSRHYERREKLNDPSSATRRTRACDCNRDAMAGFAAAHG